MEEELAKQSSVDAVKIGRSRNVKTASRKKHSVLRRIKKIVWQTLCAAEKAFSRAFAVRAYLVPALLAVLVFGYIFGTVSKGVAVEVICNGESLGYVAAISDAETAKKQVEDNISRSSGTMYRFDGDMEYRFHFEKCELSDVETIYEKLYGIGISDMVYAYALTVDGNFIGACTDKADIDEAMARIKDNIALSIGRDIEIVNDISCQQRYVAPYTIVTKDQLVSMLGASRLTEKEAVEAVNALPKLMSFVPEKAVILPIEPIDKDDLSNSYGVPAESEIADYSSLILYKTTETETYTETVPYKTVYEYSLDVYDGMTTVKNRGSLGKRTVTAQVSYVNGEETERTVLDYVTVTEPVDKVVIIGIKERPSTDPTGTFIRPITGRITCPWGWRTLFGKKDFHYGIDFGADVGTTVYASDGGVVTHAGPNGNYGIYIKIKHGNTYQTAYAHLSTVLVEVGDKVFQGQPIAKSGNTGMSTGPHLHFEVIYNGVKKNPAKYIIDLK